MHFQGGNPWTGCMNRKKKKKTVTQEPSRVSKWGKTVSYYNWSRRPCKGIGWNNLHSRVANQIANGLQTRGGETGADHESRSELSHLCLHSVEGSGWQKEAVRGSGTRAAGIVTPKSVMESCGMHPCVNLKASSQRVSLKNEGNPLGEAGQCKKRQTQPWELCAVINSECIKEPEAREDWRVKLRTAVSSILKPQSWVTVIN